MINEKDKTIEENTLENVTTASNNTECEEKREELENSKNKNEIKNKRTMLSRNLNVQDKVPNNICSLVIDQKGNLYVGTWEGSWRGKVYKCLAGETDFQPMFGIENEVWALAIDDNDNIYAGTRSGENNGNVYKCLTDNEIFRPLKGINKSVADLTLDNEGNLIALCWTGRDLNQIWSKDNYKCLKGEKEFKPMN